MREKENKTKFKSTNEIRALFLDYFEEAKHTVVASSSLVPNNDPTLLFTNAGMVQFKDVFLGKEERSYTRATSSQRCVRAGGKHNDLERVGYTARHHTFFEMLGNFSFGDYFKREAIHFAWDFLTTVLKLPKEKLWVTVYKEDQEAENIWLKEMKIDPTRFSRCGEDSNFWSMGATGPCGPCTEIFYDHGAHIAGGPPGSPDEDGDRYVEIWNLVFMQYDRAQDGTLNPLPKPSVDTGMGLERIAAVLQGVHNNYDIDVFKKLIGCIATLAKIKDLTNTSLRVIADHIRSCAFLISDGVYPSNEGRGYVLRRIIRRALRHGHQLSLKDPFFYRLVKPLADEMGDAYPELNKQQQHIENILKQEEEQFNLTLSQGLKLFDEAVAQLKGEIIPGDIVFKLYDTYGFPADLTADIAREKNLTIDFDGFETAMNVQRERSRQSSKFTAEYAVGANIDTPTEFVGYKNLLKEKNLDEGKVIAIYKDGQAVTSLKSSEKGSIILDRTPFYAESGGQIGDRGLLKNDKSNFKVSDTQKQGQAHIHIGELEKGEIKVGDTVYAEVDAARRAATVLNHTATHLLHHVLRDILGDHVIQKGSLVAPERLRFDFSFNKPLTAEQLKLIERKVNDEIRNNHEAVVRVSTVADAKKTGALGLFEDKYGDEVRVVKFGPSMELCGGTHAHHTGDIGFFKIISESGVAAGIRRIEAVTGDAALMWVESKEFDANQKISDLQDRLKNFEKELLQLKEKLALAMSHELLSKIKEVSGIKILAAEVTDMDAKALRPLVDQLKNKLGSAVIALGLIKDDKASMMIGVTKDLTSQLKAGELVNLIGAKFGAKGGGRPDLAEAGGGSPKDLAAAIDYVYACVKEKLHTN